jgi:crotonobetainyl-CoA:carnitine CoA-transferase CaiB-like acyl-CoA transferase
MTSARGNAVAPARPALADVRVIELAQFIAGPFIGMQLADYGADVVKVERPGAGDGIRTWGNRKQGVGLYHKVLNRNKRTLCADLKSPLGVEIVRRLARGADVLIESFRPGTLEKWGLGYDVLSEANPGLVLVRVSGFGQSGPHRGRPGFGSLAEAMTGFAYTNGYPDRPPLLPGFALADTTTGLAGAFLTLAALEARKGNGGLGQVVDLPIYEPLLALLGPHVIEYDQLGVVQERSGSRLPLVSPRGTFETRDGKWIAISAGAPSVFAGLCRALELPGLVSDPRFADNQTRREHEDELEEALRAAFRRFDQAELLRRFEAHDAAAAPIFSVADLVADPHVRARENIVGVADEELGCELRMQGVTGRLSMTAGKVRRAGPRLGAHSRAILIDELGFTEAELERAGILSGGVPAAAGVAGT